MTDAADPIREPDSPAVGRTDAERNSESTSGAKKPLPARLIAYRRMAEHEKALEHRFHRHTEDRSHVWVTWTLIAINVGVFVAMVASGVSLFSPRVPEILTWGASFGPFVRDGQWWRVITANYLHLGLIHIAFNMYALREGGAYIERLFGGIGMLAVYVASGIGGSLASLLWHPMIVSAGASGAIYGLYGAVCALILLKKRAIPKVEVQKLTVSALPFVAYSLFLGGASAEVDNAAHIGGLVIGFVVAACLPDPMSTAVGLEEKLRVRLVLPVALLVAAAAAFPARYERHPFVQADRLATAARTALENDDVEGALKEITASIKLHYNDPDAYVLRSSIRSRRGEYDAALEDMDRAIRLAPENADYHRARGRVLLSNEQLADASAELTRAIELDPKQGAAYFDRGLIHALASDRVAAVADFRSAAAADDGIALRCALYIWAVHVPWDARVAGAVRVTGTDPSESDRELADALARRPSNKDPAAVLSIARYLRGEMSDGALRTALASIPPVNGQKTAQSDGEFFIGMRSSIDGSHDEANEAFHQCVALRAFDAASYWLAKSVLGSITK